MSLLDWFARNAGSRREPTTIRTGPVRASVTGVYSTIHTTAGDFDTESPTRVDIDCETIVFTLPIKDAPFDGRVDSSTLHFGLINVELRVNPPLTVRRGDNVWVMQPVEMTGLTTGERTVSDARL